MTIWSPRLPAASELPLYLLIANAIEDAVRRGDLVPGQQLPPQRTLAKALSVTVGTVTRAYREAQQRGHIRGGVGSGSFVRERAGDAGQGPIDLRTHTPAFPEGLDRRRLLEQAVVGCLRGDDLPGLLAPEGGTEQPAHRAAGAAWLRRCGLEATSDEVLITGGGQHALFCALTALTRPGDVVLCEPYTNPGFLLAARQHGVVLVPVACDGEGLLPAAVDESSRQHQAKALYCMPTLANPTARTLSSARRESLAAVVRGRDLILIEDDDYGPAASVRPPPMASLLPERTVYVASLSKPIGFGLRLAYAKAPANWRPAMLSSLRASLWIASPLLAALAADWLACGMADKMLDWHREEAVARGALARARFGTLAVAADPAASHLWLPLPAPWRGDRFAHALEKTGVLVAPGEDFLAGAATAQTHVRLTLGAAATRADLERGLVAIEALLDTAPDFAAV